MEVVFKTFSTPNRYYLFDRNTNVIITISESDFFVLEKMTKGEYTQNIHEVLIKFQRNGFLLPSVIKTHKHPASDYLHDFIKRKSKQVTLQVTQNCNLRCDYCVYSGKYFNRGHSNKSMSFETAKKNIDYIMNHSCETKRIAIGFYGGEPLLEMPLIKQCISYINENYSEKKVIYTLTTNGTMFTDDILKYLFENDFIIMISLDGPKEIHDMHRKYPDGSGSFDIIIENLRKIQKNFPNHYKKVSINTLINPENDLRCVQKFYDIDSVLSYYTPKITSLSEFNTNYSPKYDEDFQIANRLGRMKVLLWMLGKVSKSIVPNLFQDTKLSFLITNRLLQPINALPETCHHSGPCIAGVERLFCDVDGNFLPCEKVSEKSDAMKIGHIETGIDLEKARQLINIGEITKDACSSCWGFMHCTQCAAAADNEGCFSAELKLSHCSKTLNSILEEFKDHCFLIENGLDFEEIERENIV